MVMLFRYSAFVSAWWHARLTQQTRELSRKLDLKHTFLEMLGPERSYETSGTALTTTQDHTAKNVSLRYHRWDNPRCGQI